MTQQFYQLTLSKVIAHYSQGDITAKGLVHLYFLIKCKPGWKIKLEPNKICQELGIGKSAFYNAISRLKAEGSIDWETPQNILVSISDSFRECGDQSTDAETSPRMRNRVHERGNQSTNAESNSTNAEKKSSEPVPIMNKLN